VRNVSAVLALSATLFTARIQAEEPRDGNWWRKASPEQRLMFVLGLYEGLNIGLAWSSPSAESCQQVVMQTFQANATRYVADTSSDQIVDGIDVLYRDFANRRIPLQGAFFIVTHQIAGDPQANIDRMINSWRARGR